MTPHYQFWESFSTKTDLSVSVLRSNQLRPDGLATTPSVEFLNPGQ